jgi:hypothetical protein
MAELFLDLGRTKNVHTHFSAIHALNVFLGVLIVGSLWRLTSLHLSAAQSPGMQHLGRAMAFQY